MNRKETILKIKRTTFLPMVIILSAIIFSFKVFGVGLKNIHLTILHTNDVHGRLQSFDYSPAQTNVGGVGRRAYLIKEIKKKEPHVLTLDAGDYAQGMPSYKLFNGLPDVEYMDQMGYDAVEIGNHEFDRGQEVLSKMVNSSKFPFLAANVDFQGNSILKSKVKKYIIKNYNGYNVGIIGLITDDLPILVNNLDKTKVSDSKETANKIIRELKPKTDLIVVLSHMGIEKDIKLAKSVPDIDVIVGGHTHSLLKKPVVINNGKNRTIIVQTGEFGMNLGRLDLNIQDKKIRDFSYKLIPVDKSVKEDPYIAREVNELIKKVNSTYSKVIGHTKTPIDARKFQTRTELTTAGVLIFESMKAKAPEVNIFFLNSGGIKANRIILPGAITASDVFELYPFDNTLVKADISGKELKSVLETSARHLPKPSSVFLQTSGIDYTIDISEKPQILSDDRGQILREGSRIKNVFVDNKPLNPDAMYRIGINDFIFNNGEGYPQLKNLKNVQQTDISFQDMIVDYIKNNSPLELKVKNKVIYN